MFSLFTLATLLVLPLLNTPPMPHKTNGTISMPTKTPAIFVLAKFRIKPNTVSILGLIIVLFGSYFFYVDKKFFGIILIFLGSAVDGLDGPYARYQNLVSERGAVLDSFIDRLGELFIWSVVAIGFTSNDIELFIVLSILVASNLIPYIRAKSESYGITNKAGITARPERVIFAVLFMFFDFNFLYVYIFAIITL